MAVSTNSIDSALTLDVATITPFYGFKIEGYNTYLSWYTMDRTAKYGLDYSVSPTPSSNGVLANDMTFSPVSLKILQNGDITPAKSFNFIVTYKNIDDGSGKVAPGTETDLISNYTITIPAQKQKTASSFTVEDIRTLADKGLTSALDKFTEDTLKLTAKSAYFAVQSGLEATFSNAPHPSVSAFFEEASSRAEIFTTNLESAKSKADYIDVAFKVGKTIGNVVNEVVDTGTVGRQSQKAFTDLSAAMLSGAVGEIVGGGTTALVAGIVGTAATTTVVGAFLPILAGVAVGALVAGALEPTIGAVIETGSNKIQNIINSTSTSKFLVDADTSNLSVQSISDLVTASAAITADTSATHHGMTIGGTAPKPAWTFNSDTNTFKWNIPPSSDAIQKLNVVVSQNTSNFASNDAVAVNLGGTVTGTGGSNGSGVLGGDIDPSGHNLFVSSIGNGTIGQVTNGQYGKLTLNQDGSYIYVSDATQKASGPVHDVFLITVNNGNGQSALSSLDITVQPKSQIEAVHRFFDTATGDHFYTRSTTEKNSIIANLPTYKYEGVGWATPEKSSDTIDVFRFNDTATNQHFFTTSAVERDQIIAKLPSFNYEGVAFQAYANTTSAGSGGVTLERFYNTQTALHHYAADAAEAYGINNGAAGPNWVDEGKAFIVHTPSPDMVFLT